MIEIKVKDSGDAHAEITGTQKDVIIESGVILHVLVSNLARTSGTPVEVVRHVILEASKAVEKIGAREETITDLSSLMNIKRKDK